MERTANVFARVESEVEEQAEQVLDRFDILMSNAVGIFLRQVVLQRGISFEMKLLAYEEEPWHSRRRFGKLKQNM